MSDPKKQSIVPLWPFLLVIPIAAVVFIVYLVAYHGGLSREPDMWILFGTYVGGTIGPLVSVASVIALVATLRLQSKIASKQDEQIEEQRNEFKLQRFDSVFFGLLQTHHQVIQSNAIGSSTGPQILDIHLVNFLGRTPGELAQPASALESFAQSTTNIFDYIGTECGESERPRYIRIALAQLTQHQRDFMLFHLHKQQDDRVRGFAGKYLSAPG